MRALAAFTLALVSAALVAGCGDTGSGKTTVSVSPKGKDASAEAADVFRNRCATCHGQSGHGDGPSGATLNPRPRNYADTEWQQKVSDEEIRRAILYGGTAIGKSAAMPAAPDLETRTDLVKALVALIRSFGKS